MHFINLANKLFSGNGKSKSQIMDQASIMKQRKTNDPTAKVSERWFSGFFKRNRHRIRCRIPQSVTQV